MLIEKPAVGFKAIVAVMMISSASMASLRTAHAEVRFHLDQDPQGQIRPFKVIGLPLSKFVKEYSRLTSTPIAVGGSWEQELNGSVTLFLRRPLKPQGLTEIFYRVLNDNGYAVVDAPARNGWVIQRIREARDAALPVYELNEVPNSSRYVNAYRYLKHADAEGVARVLRAFMPAQSRILPVAESQLFMTDTASNLRRLNELIALMDVPEAAKQREVAQSSSHSRKRVCREQRIEKLVVENLEIQESENSILPTAVTGSKRGGKK
jgi:type II secretory pathway component GspD/PulD (secretin)